MIAQLTGLVCARTDASCVIDVGGVGYLVLASTRTLAALGEQATVFTEMQVREDAITLFGFGTADEREWFRLLTTVQGVGGRVALNVLSILSPGELAAAIAGQDKGALGRASGVGPKLAVRLVTELRDKVGGMPSGGGVALPVGAAGGDTADALSALVNLGYRRAEAEAALGRVAARLAPGAALDALLREALKELAR
jgi:Holliday junction DNA helicase RuvA